jgi:hypothetical protein
MNKLSHEEYYDLVNKNSEGVPSHFQYDPLVSSGTLNIWPTPAGSESYLEVTFERQLEDLTADGQTFDFPAEWLEVLTYQLAVRLCSVFGVPGRLQDIQMIAMEMLQDKLSWDNEVNYIQLSIERGY